MKNIKYSFLIPAYNRVKETEITIKSVLNQKIKDYEIIVMDDKSTEDFTPLINKYKNKVKFLKHKENAGLSVTRNDLIKKANGKYFVLLDNDDYIDNKFLEIIDSYLKEEVDLLSFTNDEIKNGKTLNTFHRKPLKCENGMNAMIKWILDGSSFDSASSYVYNRKFFIDNKFAYAAGKTHEDFGLTPIILSKAKKIISIDEPLYHVILSDTSIIRGNDKEKIKRNIYHKLFHYDSLMQYFKCFKTNEKNRKVIFSFLSNVVLNDIEKLEKDDKKEFINELKKRKIHTYLLSDTLKRKIKKILVSLNYNFYKIL